MIAPSGLHQMQEVLPPPEWPQAAAKLPKLQQRMHKASEALRVIEVSKLSARTVLPWPAQLTLAAICTAINGSQTLHGPHNSNCASYYIAVVTIVCCSSGLHKAAIHAASGYAGKLWYGMHGQPSRAQLCCKVNPDPVKASPLGTA